MRLPCAILGILLAVFATACHNISRIDYSSFVEFPEEGMPQSWEFDFNPTASDSAMVISGHHDIVVVTRYTKACTSRSIILNIEEISFSRAKPDTFSLEIKLFSNEGVPLGKGIYGVYEIADTIRRNVSVDNGYSISLSSPLPREKTVGIKALGIVLPRNDSSLKLFRL